MKVSEPLNFGHQNFRNEINKIGYANCTLTYIAGQETVMQSMLTTYGDRSLFPGAIIYEVVNVSDYINMGRCN